MRLALENLDPECRGCLLWPVDQPLISAALVRSLIHLFLRSTASLAMPDCAGKPGHPALIGPVLIAELLAAPPDANPKHIVARHKAGAVWLPAEEMNTVEDIDTPEDYCRLTGETLASALARRAHGK